MRPLVIISLAALIGTCSSPPPILDQVLETGELRVVTRDSPTAYTITPDGPSGPEFDLVQAFADELGVALVIESQKLATRVCRTFASLCIAATRPWRWYGCQHAPPTARQTCTKGLLELA